jgi:hypothetical protein
VAPEGSSFVPRGFEPPTQLETALFVLEPLGPEHNARDHAAWASSIAHIRATPGWEGRAEDSWPHPMSPAENLADLEMHARHFRERVGFTYTVLDPADHDVLGCVYIYPDSRSGSDGEADAVVRSWVRASRAELDAPLWQAVTDWLASDAWPFARVRYAPRTS